MKGFGFTTKLIVGVVTIQVVVVSALLWNSSRLIEQSNLSVYEHTASEITSVLADSLAPMLLRGDNAAIDDVAVILEATGHFAYLTVENENGQNVVSFGSPSAFVEDPVWDMQTPIIHDGKKIGVLRTGFVTAHAVDFTNDAWEENATIAMLIILFSALLTSVFTWFHVRDLRKLREGTEALMRGDLPSGIQISSHDEVEKVAVAINHLAGHLVQSMSELGRFKSTLDNTLDCVFMFDPETLKFTYLNQGAINQIGYTKEELLDKTPLDLKPEFTEQRFREMLSPMLAGDEKSLMFETVHERKDGSPVPVEIFMQYVSPPGEEGQFIAIVRDMTERKKIEDALQKAAEGFSASDSKNFFSNLVVYLTSEMDMDYAFVGEIMPNADEVKTVSVCAKGAIADNFTYNLEGTPCRNVSKGSACYHSDNVQSQFPDDILLADMGIESYVGAPLMNEEGEVIGLLILMDGDPIVKPAFLKSILQIFSTRTAIEMERMIADNALRASKENLLLAQQIADVGDWGWNLENNTMRWSDHMYRILGFIPQEKQACLDLLLELAHPDDKDKLKVAMHDIVDNGGIAGLDYRLCVKVAGIDRVVHIHAEVVLDDFNKVVRVVGTIQDITKRKSDETALLQRQKLESLGVLTGGIAHDFNNILTSIVGNAHLAMEDIPKKSFVYECIEDIVLSSKRASDLAGQMLVYSGRGKFAPAPTNLSKVVFGMARLIDAATSKNIVVKYKLDDDLPLIDADASQMRQVVMNLLINAAESIEGADGVVTVSTGTVSLAKADIEAAYSGSDIKVGDYVFVEVADNGRGMDEEDISKVFDPFFTTKFIGRGLGLAAVFGIAREHGGAISIKSRLGVGSSFRVAYPVANNVRKKGVPPQVDVASLPANNGTATVLVVDDDTFVLGATIRMLKKAGYAVLTARDGGEALDIFTARHGSIDLVFMDINMPVLHGEEVSRKMHEIQGDVRVLLTSGYAENSFSHISKDGSSAWFLQKPYSYKELVEKVRMVLNDK